VSLVLVGLAWTLPFLAPYHRFPITAFYSEWLAFALGLAAAVPLLRRESWREAALPVVALAPLGLVAVLGMQLAAGRVPYFGQALLASLYLLWAVLLILLGQLLRREVSLATAATWLAWFLLGGGVLHSLVGLAQHYGIHGFPLDVLVVRKGEPVVYGNLSQANHYAVCLSFALASAAYLYARRALRAASLAFCIPLFLVALALAGSRSAWLYLAAFIVIALVLLALRRDGESRRLAGVAVGLPVAYIAAQWLVALPILLPAEGAAMQTAADRLFETVRGFQTRLQLWREAWQLFVAAPLLGSGLGQFAWQHFLEQALSGELTTSRVFNHAHNIVVQLLAEFGVAGVLLVGAPVLAWIADLRGVRLTLEWWWILALLSVIGIHSMLEHPLWYAYFLGVAALLLGLGAERRIAIRRAGVARAATALLVLLGCVNLVAVMAPYRDFERLVFDTAPASSAPAARAQTFTAAMMRAHRDPLLEPYVELALALGAPVRTDALQEQLELNTRAMRFAPVAAVVYRQAVLLALAGHHEAAGVQLGRALRVYPDEAEAFVYEVEELARRHPVEVKPLLELATEKFAPPGVRHEAR
jgi:O-antigen ligase